MKTVNSNPYEDRKTRVGFAVGLAAIDGGKPTVYTENLLEQYETGEITASQVKQAIIEKYTK
ncbi:antitoxin VbhA family protein [Planococcus donghaensis]|uniref:antitoxin VbhA family protein n=1 Tax=Planococcus donghaensis TaxID=414778 RepID=UPI00373668A6